MDKNNYQKRSVKRLCEFALNTSENSKHALAVASTQKHTFPPKMPPLSPLKFSLGFPWLPH